MDRSRRSLGSRDTTTRIEGDSGDVVARSQTRRFSSCNTKLIGPRIIVNRRRLKHQTLPDSDPTEYKNACQRSSTEQNELREIYENVKEIDTKRFDTNALSRG